MTLWKSILKPNESVLTALAVAGGVLAIYNTNLPTIVEIHAAPAHNDAVYSSMKKAKWTSTALVVGAYALTHDPNVFVAGGVTFLAIEWMFRHANSVDPNSNKSVPKSSGHGMTMDTAESSDDYDYASDDNSYGSY